MSSNSFADNKHSFNIYRTLFGNTDDADIITMSQLNKKLAKPTQITGDSNK